MRKLYLKPRYLTPRHCGSILGGKGEKEEEERPAAGARM